ncbi:hypothetical protein GQX74_013743 [Glossina fuscipes]|nr:hypothetical protein GQX74_013743 [Glossina fuscipes]
MAINSQQCRPITTFSADFLNKYNLLVDIKHRRLPDYLTNLSVDAVVRICDVLLQTETYALTDISVSAVASACFTNYIKRPGVPLQITSDRDTQFNSKLFTNL